MAFLFSVCGISNMVSVCFMNDNITHGSMRKQMNQTHQKELLCLLLSPPSPEPPSPPHQTLIITLDDISIPKTQLKQHLE